MSRVFSMTGFATATGALADGRGFSLTIKAVNHRHLDLQFRLPGALEGLEGGMRQAVKTQLRRGHVEVTLQFERSSGASLVAVNESLLSAYFAAVRQAAERFGVAQAPDLNALVRLPGVMTAGVVEVDAVEAETSVFDALVRALVMFQGARAAEGEALAEELRTAMGRVRALAAEAQELRKRVAAEECARLAERLKELLGGLGVSDERLLTEAALLVARSDIEEELVRLRTHIDRFVQLLEAGGEVGRQLDFLLQELNREANTMLSKSGGSAGEAGLRLTDIGLAVKVELERVREQVQNLE